MVRVLSVAILAPVLLIGIANAVWAPKPRDAELVSCDFLGVDSEALRVEASVLNRSAAWLWESFRVRVVVEGIVAPVAFSSELHTLLRGTSAPVVVPIPSVPVEDRAKVALHCYLFGGDRAQDEEGPIDSALAIDHRYQRPYGQWGSIRKIVFVSGMGTDTATAVGTFEEMAERFTRLLGASGQTTFLNFSYSGKYTLPASSTGVAAPEETADPFAAVQGGLPSAEFVAADVCLGAEPASRQLRKLLAETSPGTEFVIIGHSFGGVVAAHLLATLLKEDPDGSLLRRIHSVTTLDSPLGGYPYAPVGDASNLQALLMSRAMGCGDVSQAALDVIQGSAALERIGALREMKSRTHFVTIGNLYDMIVPAAVSHGPSKERDRQPLDSMCMDLLFHGCVLRDPDLIARLAEVAQRPWIEWPDEDDHGSTHGEASSWVSSMAPPADHRRAVIDGGRLERPEDVDVFRVHFHAGSFYLIHALPFTNVDVHLTLTDTAGRVLATSDDLDRGRFNAQIDVDAKIDGEAFVEVRTSPLRPSATGPYTLFIQEDPPAHFDVAITHAGDGAGVVWSAEDDTLNCLTACKARVERGRTVTLQAKAAVGSAFGGWAEGCAGDVCTVTADRARSVTATFHKVRTPKFRSVRSFCARNGPRVELSWDPSPGATSYFVLRDDGVGAEIALASASDVIPIAGTHIYAVRAAYFDDTLSEAALVRVVTPRCPS